MSDRIDTRGPGPVGTPTNSPAMDDGTSALVQNKPKRPLGMQEMTWINENVNLPIGAHAVKAVRQGYMFLPSDKQGRYILDLWLSGTAPDEVTLDTDDWGDYMRAEPDLQEQIHKKLESDAPAIWEKMTQSSGRLQGHYESSFHGEIGDTSWTGKPQHGGYFTGYELLHGSKKTDTLKDVQIIGQFTAVRLDQKAQGPYAVAYGVPYIVTYENLHFVWNDIVNPNEKYTDDTIYSNYSRFENKYTGKPAPKDYILHIKWDAKESTTIAVDKPRWPAPSPDVIASFKL